MFAGILRVFHDGFVISSEEKIIMHNKQSEAIFDLKYENQPSGDNIFDETKASILEKSNSILRLALNETYPDAHK